MKTSRERIPVRPVMIGVLFLYSFHAVVFAADSGDIRVQVDGLRNDTGKARISLFLSGDGFPARQEKAVSVQDLSIKDGRAEGRFSGVPYGSCAVAVIHDENENGRLDFKWKVMPAEGYGASNNPKTVFGPPSFSAAQFALDASEKTILIRMQY